MKKFLKDNLVLVAGITLPVLLVVGFLILSHLPKAMITPPNYDFLVVGYRYDHKQLKNYYLNFDIRNGTLQGKVIPKDTSDKYNSQQHASLFLYDASLQTFEELAYELPENVDELDAPETFTVPEIRHLKFSKKLRSPDGYQFEYLGYRGRGGLLGEIFGMGRRYDSHYVLSKDGSHYELPNPAGKPYYYYNQNLSFLGWVVSEGQ